MYARPVPAVTSANKFHTPKAIGKTKKHKNKNQRSREVFGDAPPQPRPPWNNVMLCCVWLFGFPDVFGSVEFVCRSNSWHWPSIHCLSALWACVFSVGWFCRCSPCWCVFACISQARLSSLNQAALFTALFQAGRPGTPALKQHCALLYFRPGRPP